MSVSPELTAQIILSDSDFQRFSALVYERSGIRLTPAKKTMLNSRLNRRLRWLGIRSFKDYYTYVTSPEGEREELVQMINEVSTNKTDFFREADHFDYLVETVLSQYAVKARLNASRKFQVWSAGCSSGEEPYTLAMVLSEYSQKNSWFDFAITATDISTRVLAIADKGIYGNERLATVNPLLKQKYFLRGKGRSSGVHKIVPELRQKITFRRVNFLEDEFDFQKMPFEVIFCRNVIIYFDRQTQVNLFRKFYRKLQPEGHIFIGHSETLPGVDTELKRVYPAVYRDIKK